MAVELGTFLRDQLERLPADHPDRLYITGLLAQTKEYIRRNDPKDTSVPIKLRPFQRSILEKIRDILQASPGRSGVFGLEVGRSLDVNHIGSVYKTLSRLSMLGLVSTVGFEQAHGRGPTRHVYNITEEGMQMIARNREDLQK